jgi:hypothetical protein
LGNIRRGKGKKRRKKRKLRASFSSLLKAEEEEGENHTVFPLLIFNQKKGEMGKRKRKK